MKDDGGPLYPTDSATGMSVRDYFASEQVAAMLSSLAPTITQAAGATVDHYSHPDLVTRTIRIAVDCGYQVAEVMLERRKQ